MKIQQSFDTFMEINKDNLKMALTQHSYFEEACKIIYTHAFERGWEEGMNDGLKIMQKEDE